MADPFSVASGAAGIISLGFTVAKALYQIAGGIGSAGEEVRSHAEEIDAFSKLLQQAKIKLSECPSVSSGIQDLIDQVVDVCGKVLKPLGILRDEIEPLLERFKSSPTKLKNLGMRIEWFFRTKSKVLFYRSALNQQHKVLDTVIGLITMQMVGHQQDELKHLSRAGLDTSLAALRLSYQENRQLASGIHLTNALPEPPTQPFITRNGSREVITEDLPSVVSDDLEAFTEYTVYVPDDPEQDIDDQDIIEAVDTMTRAYENISLEAAREINERIGFLQKSVVEEAARVKATADVAPAAGGTLGSRGKVLIFCQEHVTYFAVRVLMGMERLSPEVFSHDAPWTHCQGRLGGANVVLVCLPPGSAPLGADMKQLYSVEPSGSHPMCLSIGLACGIPSPGKEVRAGDVVVSAPDHRPSPVICNDLDFLQPGFFTPPQGFLPPDASLVAAARFVSAKYEFCGNPLAEEIDAVLSGHSRLRRHYEGPKVSHIERILSSGTKVFNDQDVHQVKIRRVAIEGDTYDRNDLIAIDEREWQREIDCVVKISERLLYEFPCLVICGICGIYERHNPIRFPEWEGNAAIAAAACTKHILSHFSA